MCRYHGMVSLDTYFLKWKLKYFKALLDTQNNISCNLQCNDDETLRDKLQTTGFNYWHAARPELPDQSSQTKRCKT